MSDLKRAPGRSTPVEYPAAEEVLRNRREFLAMTAKILAVASVPAFAASCMGIAPDRAPADPDTVGDVEAEFPPLAGDQAPPDTVDGLGDVEDEFPPLAGEPIMPDTIQPQDVKDIEDEFPPLAGDQALPDTVEPADVVEATDVEDEFPPLAGGIRMPDAVHGPDTE
ncbi:MAG: hypothetical protein ABIK09_11035 [Pseudomonadota bacterium]